MPNEIPRDVLPIPDRPYDGELPLDAKDPDATFPPIQPLLPPAGAPNVLVVLIEVPAFLFLGFWFAFQLWEGGFSIVQPQAGGGVAFFAHIGGFAFGLLTIYLVARRRRRAW